MWFSHSFLGFLLLAVCGFAIAQSPRERTSLNAGWRFSRFTSNPDQLSYDSMKNWILPSMNDFISRSKYQRPSGTPPGSNVQYVQSSFDDSKWEQVNLPHDWAIKGPFGAPGISGGEGRLPYNGIGWYRKKVTFDSADISAGSRFYLDMDGAQSYTSVFLNGVLVGGWPYGYNAFRLDLTPYVKAGENMMAIRLENKADSSRWYPGAGIYRNMWLVKTNPLHVAQYGTQIVTRSSSAQKATVDVSVTIENSASNNSQVDIVTEIFELDTASGKPVGSAKATTQRASVSLSGNSKKSSNATVDISNPKLWGPPPAQAPNMYVAVTTVYSGGNTTVVDKYETRFGVRSLTYDPNKGFSINGQYTYVKGVCNHHDLGSLGAAFNNRAAERQIQMLQDMGGNALRTSHNMPAPDLLEIADRLGFMVMAESFDMWVTAKRNNDYHLVWPDWHEADQRSFVRRERNHPSVISWSIGNEVPDQGSATGGNIGRELQGYVNQEDGTRKSTSAMNSAGPGAPLPEVIDIIGLNYQGEGNGGSYSSSFPNFHSKYPNKMIWSSESASTVSTRGTYIFPVTKDETSVVSGSNGGNDQKHYVSAYDLYSPSWASSPDKVFKQQDKYPYVAGEFVWTGWDYIGEPTPYDSSRSSYFGIIDLAGFPKDRYYLYQARWRSELAQAHILPHWTWPNRVGQTTPVHVFTSGDEAELFVNGKSVGRKKNAKSQYRLRWDDVQYQAGNISVVAYKNGQKWAEDFKKTAGNAAKLNVTADRTKISSDGYDLSFITVAVTDNQGVVVPEATNTINFSVSGAGEIVSTDNGDPTDMTAFPSLSRKAFSGLALAIVRSKPGSSGSITVSAASNGLTSGSVTVQAG